MNVYATINKRIDRANLDTTKCYMKVQKTKGGMDVEEYVGKFLKSYTMGSGNGRTLHWEFNNNGKVIRVDDEMWGSINGKELAGFSETPCNSSGGNRKSKKKTRRNRRRYSRRN